MSFNEQSKNLQLVPLSSQKRVLLIDDQPESILSLNMILNKLGYQTTIVFDGFAAGRLLTQRRFDLVIIDWNMPGLNGGECLSFIDTNLYLERDKRRPVPYITFSGMGESNISIPETVFFKHVGHWKKPMSISALTKVALRAMQKVA
jgi:CheY-like chemotaxis protein